MATISTFKCSRCKKGFSLQSGLLEKELIEISEGSDLPGSGKLPSGFKKPHAKI